MTESVPLPETDTPTWRYGIVHLQLGDLVWPVASKQPFKIVQFWPNSSELSVIGKGDQVEWTLSRRDIEYVKPQDGPKLKIRDFGKLWPGPGPGGIPLNSVPVETPTDFDDPETVPLPEASAGSPYIIVRCSLILGSPNDPQPPFTQQLTNLRQAFRQMQLPLSDDAIRIAARVSRSDYVHIELLALTNKTQLGPHRHLFGLPDWAFEHDLPNLDRLHAPPIEFCFDVPTSTGRTSLFQHCHQLYDAIGEPVRDEEEIKQKVLAWCEPFRTAQRDKPKDVPLPEAWRKYEGDYSQQVLRVPGTGYWGFVFRHTNRGGEDGWSYRIAKVRMAFGRPIIDRPVRGPWSATEEEAKAGCEELLQKYRRTPTEPGADDVPLPEAWQAPVWEPFTHNESGNPAEECRYKGYFVQVWRDQDLGWEWTVTRKSAKSRRSREQMFPTCLAYSQSYCARRDQAVARALSAVDDDLPAADAPSPIPLPESDRPGWSPLHYGRTVRIRGFWRGRVDEVDGGFQWTAGRKTSGDGPYKELRTGFAKTMEEAQATCERCLQLLKQPRGGMPPLPESIPLPEALSPNKLAILQKQFAELATQIEEIVNQCDPSPNGAYATWILRMVKGGSVVYPEDAARIRETLTAFEQMRRNPPPGLRPDINAYKQFPDLYDAVQAGAGQVGKSKRSIEKELTTKGARVAYEQGEHKVIEITTAEAAATWLRGTGWCVKDPTYARQYLRNGSLWLLMVNGERTALCQFDGSRVEFRDPSDRALDISHQPVENLRALVTAVGPSCLTNLEFAVQWHLISGEPLDDRILHRLLYQPSLAVQLAVAKGERWPELELQLLKLGSNTQATCDYELKVMKDQWPELDAQRKAEEEKAKAAKVEKPNLRDASESVLVDLGGDWSVVAYRPAIRQGSSIATDRVKDGTAFMKYGRPAAEAAAYHYADGGYFLVHKGKAYGVYRNQIPQKSNSNPLVWLGKEKTFPESHLKPFLRAIVKLKGCDSWGQLMDAVLSSRSLDPQTEGKVVATGLTTDYQSSLDFMTWAARYAKQQPGGWPAMAEALAQPVPNDHQNTGVDYNRNLQRVTFYQHGGKPIQPALDMIMGELRNGARWVGADMLGAVSAQMPRSPELEALLLQPPNYEAQYEASWVADRWAARAYAYWKSHRDWEGVEEVFTAAAALDKQSASIAAHILRYCLAKGERWTEMEQYLFRRVCLMAKITAPLITRYEEEFGVKASELAKPPKAFKPSPPAPTYERRQGKPPLPEAAHVPLPETVKVMTAADLFLIAS